jgi:hypothetical protein
MWVSEALDVRSLDASSHFDIANNYTSTHLAILGLCRGESGHGKRRDQDFC